jgi:hypothetical protein
MADLTAPSSVAEMKEALAAAEYLADEPAALVSFLAQRLGKPVLVEGPAGVGKTELAKALSRASGRELIRLQCYEGLDESKALYEWNYRKQLLAIQAAPGRGNESAASSASRPGAAGDHPLHEELAAMVAERAQLLAGESGLSGLGAVVGATVPQHLGRLRELMPDSIFLIPGIGAQGGRPGDLGPALADGRPASVLVAAARSIAGAEDPAAAAEELRAAVWDLV